MPTIHTAPSWTPPPPHARVCTVGLGPRAYPIYVGPGLLDALPSCLSHIATPSSIIVVTDAHVAPHYLAHVLAQCRSIATNQAVTSIVLPAGEGTKSWAQAVALADQILALAPDRSALLVALGGGVIGDLVGFVASIVLRGVRFVQLPTTLLSQVDSAVGGKTGINTTQGKNLIGSFYQPVAVITDTDTLRTLPRRHWRAGYAEILKYGLGLDASFFAWLETHGHAVLAGEPEALTHAIMHSCLRKAAVVEADEREGGVRALLNLGHTFGHALEAVTGYGDALLHGEAVLIGMTLAMRYSLRKKWCTAEDAARLEAHYTQHHLTCPSGLPLGTTAAQLMEAMGQDKKRTAAGWVLVVIRAIGDACLDTHVDLEVVEAIWREYV